MKISEIKLIHKLEKVNCPKGTIPIRRITKDDLNREKSLFNTHILTQNSIRSFVSSPLTIFISFNFLVYLYKLHISFQYLINI